ncbi:MAG: hypothetical protein DRG78_24010 [Epsilonproteobacteria bacterium]|nr:MAG: hypothetical protein DRG78_24010 [Campylobacterota bacterium]
MVDLDNLTKLTKNIKLLYVEDNQDAREATFLILEDIFDEIIVAVDGQDGLEKYKCNNIDLILTDIDMPNMNGLEMSKAIKKIDPNQSIIILTALTDIKVIKYAIDIDINSFINKPIEDIDILFHKIEQCVQKIHYEKDLKEKVSIEQEREKVQLVYKMIHNISHHWRQPLSIITAISSGCSFKVENNIELTKKDFEGVDIITKKAEELSDIFKQIENLDFDTIKVEDIEKIIEISEPIYKREKENLSV